MRLRNFDFDSWKETSKSYLAFALFILSTSLICRQLEEQRRQKVKERLIALEAAKKQQAEDQARLKESGGNLIKETKPDDIVQKRKPETVDYEELEAKKRRKLQVGLGDNWIKMKRRVY